MFSLPFHKKLHFIRPDLVYFSIIIRLALRTLYVCKINCEEDRSMCEFQKILQNQVHFRVVKPKLNKATSTFNFVSLSSGFIWLQKFCIMEIHHFFKFVSWKLLKRQLKNASFESKDTCKYFL